MILIFAEMVVDGSNPAFKLFLAKQQFLLLFSFFFSDECYEIYY